MVGPPGAGKSMLAARPQVSNIAQSILSELDRVRGS
jgi:predicted ATPase with chaperone activity